MAEVELTRHNVLQRGITPPPEEKVAYYVYQQSKYDVDRPESNNGTEVILSYAAEPVAWAPELPSDWHSSEHLANQTSYASLPYQSANPSSAQIASNSFGSMTRLGLNNPNLRRSIDHDLADLEAEVMGGTEVDYNLEQQGPLPDIASDVQEQSIGQRTPQMQTAALVEAAPSIRTIHTPSPQKSGRRSVGPLGREKEPTPARERLPSIRGESVAPATPKTTGIHIQIQPPTDPALSRAASTSQLSRPPIDSPRRSGQVNNADIQGSPRRHVDHQPSPLRTEVAAQPSPTTPRPLPNRTTTPTPNVAKPSLPTATDPEPPTPNLPPSNQAPVPNKTEPKSKEKKMAKKKTAAGAAGAKKKRKDRAAAPEVEDDGNAVEMEPIAPQTPAPVNPPTPAPGSAVNLNIQLPHDIPAGGIAVENRFDPDGHVESVTVRAPTQQSMTPRAAPRDHLTEDGDAPTVRAKSPSHRAPSMSHEQDAWGFDEGGEASWNHIPLPQSRAPSEYIQSPHTSRGRIQSPLATPLHVEQSLLPESQVFRTPRVRDLQMEAAPRSPSHGRHSSAGVDPSSLDPALNGGHVDELADFLSATPRIPSRHATPVATPRAVTPRLPVQSPLKSPAMIQEPLVEPLRQEEYQSYPLEEVRAASRAGSHIGGRSQRAPSPSPAIPSALMGQDSVENMWHAINRAPVQQDPPVSPLEEQPTRPSKKKGGKGKRLSRVPEPEPVRMPEPEPVAAPEPEPEFEPVPVMRSSHMREPAIRDSSIRGSPAVDTAFLPTSPRAPSARAPSVRAPSVRAPSVREPSIRAMSPPVREPSVRAQSPLAEIGRPLHPLTPVFRDQARAASPANSRFNVHPLSPTRGPAPPSVRAGSVASRRERPTSPPASVTHSSIRPASTRPRPLERPLDHPRERSVHDELAALETMQEDEEGTERTRSPPADRITHREADSLRTPRTSYSVSPSTLASEVNKSHFHDEDLCVLLHAADDTAMPEAVRKAVRKAVRARVKKLGLENEDQYRMQHMHKGKHHKHRWSLDSTNALAVQAPDWARPLFQLLEQAQEKLESLDYKIEQQSRPVTSNPRRSLEYPDQDQEQMDDIDDGPSVDYEPGSEVMPTPYSANMALRGQTIEAPQHGDHSAPVTGSSSRFDRPSVHNRHGTGYDPEDDLEYDDEHEEPHSAPSRENGIEEENYRLKMRESDYDTLNQVPEIPSAEVDDEYYDEGRTTPTGRRVAGPAASQDVTPASGAPAFAGSREKQLWANNSAPASPAIPPWQLVHQRLLNWTMVWSESELERALASTERGQQVDECSLTIWTTQCYKRYVRARGQDHPQQAVDRLFVPPNVADAINSAVYNGRHSDASALLRDLWEPFGFKGMPRLILVLVRHRRDPNHWVVHRFSIPEGSLCTYDTYPERALADGRTLAWWFAIRTAWPHAMYPNADHLVQKLVRIHRPIQLLTDNSLAAAAIWRNLLMGSKAERSVDLVRMRDLLHTEVQAIKARKEQGKLALPSSARPGYAGQIMDA